MERFRIRYPGHASLVRDLTSLLDRGDVFLAHAEAGALRNDVVVVITGPNGREVDVVGRVKQALAGVGAAVEFPAIPAAVAMELDDWLLEAQEKVRGEGDLPPARVESMSPGEARSLSDLALAVVTPPAAPPRSTATPASGSHPAAASSSRSTGTPASGSHPAGAPSSRSTATPGAAPPKAPGPGPGSAKVPLPPPEGNVHLPFGPEESGELVTDYAPPTPLPGSYDPAELPELPPPPPTRPVALPVTAHRTGVTPPPIAPAPAAPPAARHGSASLPPAQTGNAPPAGAHGANSLPAAPARAASRPTPPPPIPAASPDSSDHFSIDEQSERSPFETDATPSPFAPPDLSQESSLDGLAGDGQLDWPSSEPEPSSTGTGGRAGGFDPSQVSPMQLGQLSVPERMQAALKGGRDVRLALLRDTNKALHVYVIKNPRITKEEIALAARMASVNPEVLTFIASHAEWLAIPGVALSLVKNPKTPTPLAVELIERLPLNDVRAIAKTQSVRQAILQAARKRVT